MPLFKKKKTVMDELSTRVLERMERSDKLDDGKRPDRPDFGYTVQNPVFTLSIDGSDKYLSRLRTENNEYVYWRRTNSCYLAAMNGVKDVMVDQYQLYLHGEYYIDIYICPYGHNTSFVPKGFILADESDDDNWKRDIEEEAKEKGLTIEQLIEIKKLEHETKAQQKRDQEEESERREKQIADVKKKYPSFNMRKELKNELFSALVELKVNIIIAYEYTHRDKLFPDYHAPLCEECTTYSASDYYKMILRSDRAAKIPTPKSAALEEIKEEASSRGVSVEQLCVIKQLERENAKLKWEKEQHVYARIAEEAAELQRTYPRFDLTLELKSDLFWVLAKELDAVTAYEICHFSDLYYPVHEEKKPSDGNCYCHKCGSKLYPDSLFCSKCGAKIPVDNESKEMELPNKDEEGSDQGKIKVDKLAEVTVDKIREYCSENRMAFTGRSDLTHCDTILFATFMIRFFCITASDNRKIAEKFSNDYVSGIEDRIQQVYARRIEDLSEMISNRWDFYDRVFMDKENDDEGIAAVIEEFEYIIKTDIIEKAFVPYNEKSSLPVMSITDDYACRAEVQSIVMKIPELVSPYFEEIQDALQDATLYVRGKMILPSFGKEFFPSTVSRFFYPR